ncbi:MAG: hypothetical protein QM757_45390 [Paludibaculum sp.]
MGGIDQRGGFHFVLVVFSAGVLEEEDGGQAGEDLVVERGRIGRVAAPQDGVRVGRDCNGEALGGLFHRQLVLAPEQLAVVIEFELRGVDAGAGLAAEQGESGTGDDIPRQENGHLLGRIDGGAVFQGDPALVARDGEGHRAGGQPGKGARELGGFVATGIEFGFSVDGGADGHSVPKGDFGAGLEVLVPELLEHAGDQETRLSGLVEVEVGLEGQKCHGVSERGGQSVEGVRIPQGGQGGHHIGMEAGLGHVRIDAGADQAQALHRVDGIAGALEGQVGVELIDDEEGLVDNGVFFGQAEFVFRRLGGGQERGDVGDPKLLQIIGFGALPEKLDRRGGARAAVLNDHAWSTSFQRFYRV